MSKHLERDLETLQRDILGMGAAVEEAIYKAIRALQDRDVDLARDVIAGDNAIDEAENRIEEECLKILALHQPVAIDLRRVAAVLAINVDLERMADLAVDIAERAEVLAAPPFIPVPDALQRMTDLTTAMVRECLDAFVHLDVPAGPQGHPARRRDRPAQRRHHRRDRRHDAASRRTTSSRVCRCSAPSATWSGSPTTPPTWPRTWSTWSKGKSSTTARKRIRE